MKYLKYILISGAVLLFACTKNDDVSAPDFDVSIKQTTFKKGEPVTFSFTGNAEFISFYTGETGKEFAYKDGRVMDVSAINLSFNSAVTGTGSVQTEMFSLMVSSDFNGDYSSFSNVETATWTDVTNRLTKQEAATGTAFSLATPANGIDLTDLRVPGKPLYIAFRYNIRQQSLYGTWRTWTFQAFNLTAASASGSQVLGNMSNTTFRVIQKNPEIISRTSASTTLLTLQHADLTLNPAAAEIPTQSWIISQAFRNINRIDYGPDLATPIQGGTAVEKKEFSYTFTKAGTYKVYFVAANVSAGDKKEIIKMLDITITD